MAKKRGIKGKSVRTPAAEWEPLLDLAPAHVPDFMWMGSVELPDKTRLQLYKHYWTRNYLHLDGDGRAFVYAEPDRYEEIEPTWLLTRALREHTLDRDWFDIVHPLRPEPDEIPVEWTDSATKNGIARERSAYVVKHCGLRYKDNGKTLFVGVDEDGAELEVAAVGDDDYGQAFVVFHAAEMRREYRGLLLRAERWRQ
jgi:hypothetical protein